jgi:N-acetylglucosaminyl-diphospho-decaprenol L-rhamnosyltransferase
MPMGDIETLPASEAKDTLPLSAILVSYRTRDLLANCLRDLARISTPHEVIVVDNASPDGSADMVAQRFPGIQLVRNRRNVGFARAVNQVLPACRGRYTLLLNPDTSFEPTALDTLVGVLDGDESIGAAGPAIRHPGDRLKVLSAGRQPTVWRLLTHATGLSRLSRRIPALEGFYLVRGIHDDRQRDVEWLTGACLLVRTSIVRSLGGLTERWFMYAEDLELSRRIRLAGYRLVHVPQAQLLHDMGASGEPEPGGADAGAATSTGWAVALHEYHREFLAANKNRDATWRAVFALQLLSRSAYYRLKALSNLERRPQWRAEAAGFAACARAVARRR